VKEVDYSKLDAIEAVNGGSLNNSGSPVGQYSSIPFWEERLNAGVRITAIGGSDNHNADSPPEQASSVGVPTTVVHASELSQAAILEGIRKGHVFVDIWGSAAGLLEVEAEAKGQRAEMGDSLALGNKAHVRLSVHVAGVPQDAVIAWTGDGAKLMTAGMKPVQSARHAGTARQDAAATPARLAQSTDAASTAADSSSGEMRRTFDLIADGHPHWLRADVHSADGKLLLLGNPIYLTAK
jgi:hypothetical protein